MASTSSRPLDRALAGRAFVVDEIACASAADIICNFYRKDRDPHGKRRSLAAELLLRLSIAAICHQINWDFLSEKMAGAFDGEHLTAERLSLIGARDVEKWLDGYQRPERIRAKERAMFLRDVGRVLIDHYSGNPRFLVERAHGKLYGATGFIRRLDDFSAFHADPLRKKSNVLVHELIRDDIAHFDDENNVAPAIDYHIMRLYLRTGRIAPIHQDTFSMLKADSEPRPRLVKLMREAVAEALSLTALYARMSIPQVNGVEWEIGREICVRTKPKCDRPTKLPALISAGGKCPYSGFCQAFRDAEWRRLREPDLKKSFY